MATATSRLRLEKQAYDANDDSWGTHLNDGVFDLVDESWGTVEVTVSSDITLTSQNYFTDQSRHFCLILSGDGGYTVTAPAVDKPYLIVNNCSDAVTVKPAGGTGASIGAGKALVYYTNAAATFGYFVDTKLNKLAAPDANVDLNNKRLVNVAAATSSTDAVTRANAITDLAAPSGNLSINSHRLTNVADPTSAQDAATKNYIDTLAASSDLGTVAAIASDVTTVASISSNVTSVAGNATNINTVATNIADVNAVGSNIANVLSVDGNSTNINTVAGSIANVNTVATDMAAVTNVSTNMADVQNASAIVSGLSLSAGTGLTSTGDLVAGQTISANVGTTAGKLVQLDGSSRLPAVDGSQLTGISASQNIYGTTTSLSSDAVADFTLEVGADEWFFSIKNVIPATDNVSLVLNASDNGGTTYAVNISRLIVTSSALASNPTVSAGSGTSFTLAESVGSDTNEYGVSGTVHIFPSSGEYTKILVELAHTSAAGNVTRVSATGRANTTNTLTHIRFKCSSGNLESGEITPGYVIY